MKKNFFEGVESVATAIFVVGILGLLIIFLSPVLIGGIQLLRYTSI